jgi:hypothetical protein
MSARNLSKNEKFWGEKVRGECFLRVQNSLFSLFVACDEETPRIEQKSVSSIRTTF